MKRKREAPARKQASEEDVFDERPQSAFYNIYYDKVEDFSKWRDRRDAKLAGKRFQLDVEKDSGETRATSDAALCLYFARGKCVHGSECKFFHRVPNEDDESRISLTTDIFGRERHKSDREDMGGIGSFNRDNRTLYIGGIRTSTPDAETKIRTHFGMFGPIEKINIIHGRSIVFVTYKLRVSAEFAKEAVADQSVVSNEVVNVRWAHEDPNPRAIHEKEERVFNQAITAIHGSNPEYFSQYEALHGEGLYPQTDHQYGDGSAPNASAAAAAASQPLYPQGNDSTTEWVQVGDEATGYYWVPATNPAKDDGTKPDTTEQATASTAEQATPSAAPASTEKPADAPGVEPQTAAPSEAEAAPAVEATPEEQAARSYYVWQSYYAANGYPYYYDESGQVVYYDPSHYDQATLTQFQARSQPPLAPQLDAYQYYGQMPVNRTDTSYFSHFQSYSEEKK